MVQRWSDSVHLAMRSVPVLMALALAVAIVPAEARAQTWRVDSRLSVARLSLGSGPDAIATGLARVSGQVVFDSNHPANSTVHLIIAPGNDTDSQNVRISFTSKQSAMTSDGKLIVEGNLAVTRIEPGMTMNPSEAFAGPVYGKPVDRTDTHPVTLVFSLPRQGTAHHRAIQLSGSTSVARRDFPQFLDALTLADWPTELVNDRTCEFPLSAGEDFSGARCTGTLIASVSNAQVRVGRGEDFSGFRPAVAPDLDHGTLTIDMRLTD